MNVTNTNDKVPVCKRYMKEVAMKRQIYISPWQTYNIYKSDTVTLVVHLTISKIPVFSTTLSKWTGPVSATIYVHATDISEMKTLLDLAMDWQHRDNIDLHIVPNSGVSQIHAAIKYFAYSQSIYIIGVRSGSLLTTLIS